MLRSLVLGIRGPIRRVESRMGGAGVGKTTATVAPSCWIGGLLHGGKGGPLRLSWLASGERSVTLVGERGMEAEDMKSCSLRALTWVVQTADGGHPKEVSAPHWSGTEAVSNAC